jgi:two-component system chemotaxis response regulator CheB
MDICRDGLEAYETLKKKTYDCVVLDIQMPRMDGLQLLERLQKEGIRARIIMVSTLTTKDADVTILAMERGAIDFVTKPCNVIEAKGDDFKKRLMDVLHAVTGTPYEAARPEKITVTIPPRKAAPMNSHNKLVALACSTGGPKSLQSVIPLLPANLDAPMVLVQHMPPGFTKPMADRLDMLSKIKVKEAEDGEKLKKGVVYIAPGGFHMEVAKNADGSHRIVLNDSLPAIGGLKPCANITYDSLAKTGYDEIVCVVLTGMGSDGTKGILSLERSKPIHVIAQNEKSCVVYGMPKAIADAGVVDEVVPLDDVAKTITKNVGVK